MTTSSRMLHIAPLLAVLACGCGGGANQCADVGPPVSADATVPIANLQTEICRFYDRCGSDELASYVGGTVDDCLAYYACTADYPDGWTITPNCIDAVRTAACDAKLYEIIGSNTCEIGGPIPYAELGERCGYDVCRPGADVPGSDVRCGDGLYCGRDDVCEAYLAVGQPCSIDESPGVPYDPCTPGSHCDFAAGTCAADLQEGDMCVVQTSPQGTLDIDPCALPTRCTDGTCQAPTSYSPFHTITQGEPCDDPQTCQYGLTCVGGYCNPIVCPGNSGDPCDGASCSGDMVCNSYNQRCEARGRPCDPQGNDCSLGQFCDEDTDTCQSY